MKKPTVIWFWIIALMFLFESVGNSDIPAGEIDLSTYKYNNINNIVKIYGLREKAKLGFSIGTGDLNRDGCDDIVIGTIFGDTRDRQNNGELFILFGSKDFESSDTIELGNKLPYLHRISQHENDIFGSSVSIGDIDGDSYNDVIAGAIMADPLGRENAGEVYIIFGKNKFTDSIDLGKNTHEVSKILGYYKNGFLGSSVITGDIDGDGYDDIVVGAKGADPAERENAGEVYVIYGSQDFPKEIDLKDTSHRVVKIYGAEVGDTLGGSVAVGDVSWDNNCEIIVSAACGNPLGRTNAGEVYIIKGRETLPPFIDLSHQSSDFISIYGGNAGNFLGESVSSGKINNDKYDDIVIGAFLSDPEFRRDAGEVYIIYGRKNFTSNIDLYESQSNVTTIVGGTDESAIGNSVCVGNINGDKYGDVIIGAAYSSPSSRKYAGEIYVIYGDNRLDSKIDLAKNPSGVVKISGNLAGDAFGTTVKTGDINGDGIEDIIAGAPLADFAGMNDCGITYVVFGREKQEKETQPSEQIVRPPVGRSKLVPNNVQFQSDNYDVLCAGETAHLDITIKNEGGRDARNVYAVILWDNNVIGFAVGESTEINRIGPDESTTITVPITGSRNLSKGEVELSISVLERDGDGLGPLKKTIRTMSYQPPELEVYNTVWHDDNDNGRIEPEEEVEVHVTVENKGFVSAQDVTAKVNLGDELLFFPDAEDDPEKLFELGNINPDQRKSFNFRFSTKPEAQNLPVSIILMYGNTVDSVPLDLPDVKREGIKILPDVDTPPITGISNPCGIAVVIGNKDYTKPDVGQLEYAIADAYAVKEYLKITFGIHESRIIYQENATLADFNSIFGTEDEHEKGKLYKLAKQVEAGEGAVDIYIYYSGHGSYVMDKSVTPPEPIRYLLPVNCGRSPDELSMNAYSTKVFLDNIAKIEPRSLMIFRESCFSGVERTAQITITTEHFLMLDNAVMLSSSTGYEESGWSPVIKHGYFTYCLLRSIKDCVNDILQNDSINKEITASDIFERISDVDIGVSSLAKYYGGGLSQTPDKYGNINTVVLEIK